VGLLSFLNQLLGFDALPLQRIGEAVPTFCPQLPTETGDPV
jgi:hypothetical protein